MGANFSSEPVVEKDTERALNDTFTVAVSSCQGWRMSQEDNHSLILDLPGEHKASFFAVYDGHGSARVSKHASEGLWRHLIENDSYKKGNFKEALEGAFLSFDHEVNDSYNAQMAGTTAICVLIVDNIIYCANIGDSRAVASVNCECIPLSHDHKPENPLELKRILAAGGYVLGNRVNGNLALSRAFGDFHYKGNEQLPPEQQIVSPCPDIKRIDLNDDVDFIVLACDGIWDVLTSEEVVKFVISRLEQNVEAGLICEQLTTRCIATDYELVIGCDNMTVLVVCYTRGRSWSDYCNDIFNKNSLRLGVTRTRTFEDPSEPLSGLESEARRMISQMNIINSPTITPTTISEEDNLLDRSETNQDRADEFLSTNFSNDDPPQQPTTEQVPVEQEDGIPDNNEEEQVSTPSTDDAGGQLENAVDSSSITEKVTEIQLSSPDEDESNVQEDNTAEGDQDEQQSEDPIDTVEDQSSNHNEESNIIEIELGSPDDGAEETDSNSKQDEVTGQDNPTEEAQPTEESSADQQEEDQEEAPTTEASGGSEEGGGEQGDGD